MNKRLPIRFQVPYPPGIPGCLAGWEAGCPSLTKAFPRKSGSAPIPGCPILAKALRRKGGIPRIRECKAFVVNKLGPVWLCTLFLCLTAAGPIQASAQAPQPTAPVVLDRVVAVVNNQAILTSDIDDEISLSVLDPSRGGLGVLTRTRALDQLIGRALIQQQIHQEDAQAAEPSQDEVDARLMEIRKELPACVRENCASDAGWSAFLFTHGLTPKRVDTHLRHRVEILRFIEQRFRQGISISPQEIDTYYHNTLVPQYAKGETIPPLDQVSTRIQEILLQQRVNALFDDWLSNLRKQGDIEVLDESLQAPALQAPPQQAPAPQTPATPNVSPAQAPGGSGKASQ